MNASIISETWHEARLEETKIESKINKRNFHRFIIASTSQWKAIAPQTDSTSSFFHRLEFKAKSVLAELLSCAKKLESVCLESRQIPRLLDSIFFFISFGNYSETLFREIGCLCFGSRAQRQIFLRIGFKHDTSNLLSDNLGRKSFSSYQCDQSRKRRESEKMFFRDFEIAPERKI